VRLSDTLTDLALAFAAEAPHALPHFAAGTRLVFQLVYVDAPPAASGRGGGPHPRGPRYKGDYLGSVVIGGENTGGMRAYGPGSGEGGPGGDDERADELTLEDTKLVAGDSIVMAVMPPHEDGTVASAESAMGDAFGAAAATGGMFAHAGRGGGRGMGRGAMPPMRGDWHKGEALAPAWGPGQGQDQRRGRGRW
jgi:histone deacetylase complex subunit SAP18